MTLLGRVSLEEFLAAPDDKPYQEYLCGRVVAKALPKEAHSLLQAELAYRLVDWSRRGGGGKTMTEQRCILATAGERHVQLPDVAWFAPGARFEDGNAVSPPTLAVEILSPDDSFSRLQRKIRIYLDAGVGVLWIVDPEEQSVSVYRKDREPVLLEGNATLSDPTLPGLAIDLPTLFGP